MLQKACLDSNICERCSSNKIGDGAGDCTQCPNNSTAVYYEVSDNTAELSICRCDAGYYDSVDESLRDEWISATNCDRTDIRYWYASNQNNQTGCPPGSFSSTPGADKINDCRCQPGFYYTSVRCIGCPIDTYCPGGSIMGNGQNRYNCPPNSTTWGKFSRTIVVIVGVKKGIQDLGVDLVLLPSLSLPPPTSKKCSGMGFQGGGC
jgi:hypothetical protein